MQEHSAHQLEAASMDNKSGANSRIRQVWRHNLEQEMAVLRQLIIKYPYVSMVCYHSNCDRNNASLELQTGRLHPRAHGAFLADARSATICRHG